MMINSLRTVVTLHCSWRASLDRPASSLCKAARGCSVREVLSASGVLDPFGWIDWAEPGEWLDRVVQRLEALLCGRVATGAGVMGSFLTNKGEFSVRGSSQADDGVCVLEARYCMGEWEAARETVNSCSIIPLELRLKGSSIQVEEEAVCITSPRSTSIMVGSLKDSATFQSCNSLKLNMKGYSPPFSPSGQTTKPLHCSSCHMHTCCRQTQAVQLCRSLVITPICPMLDSIHGPLHHSL